MADVHLAVSGQRRPMKCGRHAHRDDRARMRRQTFAGMKDGRAPRAPRRQGHGIGGDRRMISAAAPRATTGGKQRDKSGGGKEATGREATGNSMNGLLGPHARLIDNTNAQTDGAKSAATTRRRAASGETRKTSSRANRVATTPAHAGQK